MKKIVLAFMVIFLVGSLVACAGRSGDAKNKTSEKHTAKNVKDTKKSDDAKKNKTNNLSKNNTEKSTDEELKEESLDLEEIYWQEDEYVSSDDTPGENRGSDDQEPISPEPTPAPEPSPEPESWMVGIAGAYGGSSDPGCGSRTATGELIDDSSMGVSIPMAWPNYHTYFGRMVEIKYGDTIVLAKINDCGYMGGGSMSLDLQPGVFKAFGFDSCNAWGIREVSYRIF